MDYTRMMIITLDEKNQFCFQLMRKKLGVHVEKNIFF